MTDSWCICLIHLCKVVFLNFGPPLLSTVTLITAATSSIPSFRHAPRFVLSSCLVLSCLVIGKPSDEVSRRWGSGCGLLAPMALWMQTFPERVDWWCFNVIVPVNDGSRKQWVSEDWCLCCYIICWYLCWCFDLVLASAGINVSVYMVLL